MCTNVGCMEHAVVCLSVRTGTVEFRETSSQLASLLTTSAALLSPQVAIGLGQARHGVKVRLETFPKRSDGSQGGDATKAPVQTSSELGVGSGLGWTSRQVGCLERDMGVVWENRALYDPVRSWSTREAIFVSGSYIVGWVG